MSKTVDQIREDMFAAVKDKNSTMSGYLKLVLAAFQNAEIAKGEPLTDDEILAVIVKESKKLKDSISQFESGGRMDLVESSQTQLQYLEKYLPVMMSEDELRVIVQSVITKTGASSMQDMGKVMGAVMAETKGKADGAVVNSVVKELLS